MRLRWLLVPLMLLLPGCLDTAEEPAATAPRTTYRFVEVQGEHRAEAEGEAGVCGFDPLPEVNASERSIRFPGNAPDARTTAALVVSIVWDRTACGVAVSDWSALTSDRDMVGGSVAGYGELTIQFRGEDAILVDGETLPLGGELRLSRSGTDARGRPYATELVVRDHGHWPSERISTF